MKKRNQKILDSLIFTTILVITFTVVFPVFHFQTGKPGLLNGYFVQQDPDSTYKKTLTDSLPFKLIKTKIDSIDAVTEAYMNPFWDGGYSIGGLFGVQESRECDTCDYGRLRFARYDPPKTDIKYYILLNDFVTIEDSLSRLHKPVYFKKKGKFYKKYLKPDSSLTQNNRNHTLIWVTEEKKYGINELFLSTHKEAHKNVIIPVSKTVFIIWKILSYVISLIFLIIFLGFLARNFILFILDLSKGEAFTQKNYQRLFYIAYTLLFCALFIFTVKLIIHLTYKKYYTGDFTFYYDWGENAQYIMVALITLLIAKAIKRGYEIKQEQDLTV